MSNIIVAVKALEEEKHFRKFKYQLFVTIASHVVWGVVHNVLDLTNKGSVYPHIFVAVVVGLSYYAGEVNKVEIRLTTLRNAINAYPLLVRRELAVRDYVEVVAAGLWKGLGVCGAVEILDLAFGVHGAGSPPFSPGARGTAHDLEAGAK